MPDNTNNNTQKVDTLFFDQVDINVENLYNSIIKKIDGIRSYVALSSVKIDKNINLDKQDFDEILKKNLKKETTPQESRCHAFYRLLGLPAVGKDGYGYSPGFDQDNNSSKKILKIKLNTYNNIDDQLLSLMSRREDYYNNFTNIFSRKDINASALALSSLDKRLFLSSFRDDFDINPFDPEISNQGRLLSDSKIIDLFNSAIDPNGNHADFSSGTGSSANEAAAVLKNPLISRYHIIKPFMVDPRIDLSVSPSVNLVTAPFMNDDTKRLIFNNVKLEVPIIENVCRQRLNVLYQDQKIGDFTKRIIDFVKSSDDLFNNEFLKKVFSDSVTNPDQDQIAIYLNTLFKLITILYENISKVKSTLEKWNYVPVPNNSSLETEPTTAKIIPKDANNTDRDKQLVNIFIQRALIDMQNSFIKENTFNLNDNGDFSIKNASSSQLQNNSSNSVSISTLPNSIFEALRKERDSDCHDASIALKRIEMLMGEFSGFGIIDYYIMYIALYAIEKETLINLLDDISFSRLKENGELLGDEVLFRMFNDNKPTFDMKKALIRFEIEVRRIADLADIFYFSISQ